MIRELKTLVAVAHQGTFAAAGEKVGLTQAAVSAQMQRLESELGFEIFDRKGRSAVLNKAGQQTLARAQELIRLYDNLGSTPAALPANVLVKVGAIASAQRSFLPSALARFHRQCRGCRSHVMPGLSMDLVNLVDAGEIDMAIVIRPPFPLPSDLQWTTLVHEPFRLVVPRKVRGKDWAELLSAEPFIRYERASFGGRLVDRFLRGRHFTVHEVCEVDELEAMVELVANDVGVALVPETANYRHWPSTVRAIDLGKDTFHRDVGLVHRGDASLSEPARMLAPLIGKLATGRPTRRGELA